MIYFKHTEESQQVYVPRVSETDATWLDIWLYDNEAQQSYRPTISAFEAEGNYYKITLALPELTTGEYNYNLYSDAEEGTGLAIVLITPEVVIVPDSGIETIEFAKYEE